YGGGNLHIVVEDTGSGMSREEQARIFNAFEQLPNAASQEGFGLGLSIVQRIVGMLKGTIDVESIKGKGTRFSVSLPMGTADEIPAGAAEPVPAACAGTLFSVIVLDDNESLLSMMKEMFARNGVRCDVASNISDLMEAIRNRGY
ncbi:hybrid sensor histidine kinase/response regulator, partial [Bacteroides fragilis]|uniref:hybrid sensor histidine kinase/response regulator n=1 Tax=Bacteroides fragilis TaxID=817 RepID=UPI00044C9FB8